MDKAEDNFVAPTQMSVDHGHLCWCYKVDRGDASVLREVYLQEQWRIQTFSLGEPRGAEGAEWGEVWGGGVPLPTGGEVWGAPSPENVSNLLF